MYFVVQKCHNAPKSQLGLLMHRRKHEVSPLLSPGWQRECSAQDFIRQLTSGEKQGYKNRGIMKNKHSYLLPHLSAFNCLHYKLQANSRIRPHTRSAIPASNLSSPLFVAHSVVISHQSLTYSCQSSNSSLKS